MTPVSNKASQTRGTSVLPAHTASPSAVMDAHKATTINLWEIKVSGPDQVIIWRSDETLPAFRWEGSELTDEAQSSRIRCRLFTINCLTYGAWKPVYYRPLPSLYLQDKHYAKDLLQKARCQLLIFLNFSRWEIWKLFKRQQGHVQFSHQRQWGSSVTP